MTGYMGRVGIYETAADLARAQGAWSPTKADLVALREQAFKEGMKPLRIRGAMKVGAGLTTIDEVLKVAPPVRDNAGVLGRLLDVLLLVAFCGRRLVYLVHVPARAPADRASLRRRRSDAGALPRPDRAVGRLVLGDRRRAPHHAGSRAARRWRPSSARRRPTASASGRSRASRSSRARSRRIASAWSAQLPFFDLEIARTDERGARQVHIISGQARLDADGGFLGYRGVGRDVTEQRARRA